MSAEVSSRMSAKRPPWLSGALLVLAGVFFMVVFVVRIGGDMVDFEVNYRAATRARAGESLYPTTDGHFMFKYLPFSATLYLPLSFLPVTAAKAIWYGLTVLCTIGLFVVSARLVSPGAKLPRFAVVLPVLVLAKFCFRELKLGQVNTIVVLLLLLMLAALVSRERGRPVLTGVLFGLATAIKPYGMIFLPYFLLRGAWTSLAAGVGVLGAAFLLPAIFYGLEGNVALHREWLTTLSQSTPAQLMVNDNVSVVGLVAKWTGDPGLASRAGLVTTPLLGLLVLAVMRRGRALELERAPVLEGALLLTLIPLVSPLGWDYQLLTSVLAMTLIAHNWEAFPRPARVALGINLAVIALTIYDVIGRAAYRAFMSWSILTLSFLVVLGAIAWLRFRRAV